MLSGGMYYIYLTVLRSIAPLPWQLIARPFINAENILASSINGLRLISVIPEQQMLAEVSFLSSIMYFQKKDKIQS